MILLSGAFCGDNHSFDYTPTNISNINNIKIGNGIYDEIYATKGTNGEYDESSKIWGYDTLLFALFKNNLFGGNVEFTSDSVSAIRIKRRKLGTYKWDTFYEKPITTNDDFNFEWVDKYVRGKTEYEWAFVPVINGSEGNLNTNRIKTEFDGFYFIEKDVVYRAILNTQINPTRNQDTAVVKTLNRRYPFTIKNGKTNYTSGNFQATFIEQKDDCTFDIDNGWSYRERVTDFLTNGKNKILKNDEGKMWMVSIIDGIPENADGHYQNVITNITFVETGDAESVEDLYIHGLLDLDPVLVR